MNNRILHGRPGSPLRGSRRPHRPEYDQHERRRQCQPRDDRPGSHQRGPEGKHHVDALPGFERHADQPGVGIDDYERWKQQYGTSTLAAIASPVAEIEESEPVEREPQQSEPDQPLRAFVFQPIRRASFSASTADKSHPPAGDVDSSGSSPPTVLTSRITQQPRSPVADELSGLEIEDLERERLASPSEVIDSSSEIGWIRSVTIGL